MNNYVYVLVKKDKDMFKVGSSMNVLARIKQLEKHWGKFNGSEEGSFLIKCNEVDFRKIESMIHKMLDRYWVNDLEKKDGSREFFKIESLDILKQFIEDLTEYKDSIEICNIEEELSKLQEEEDLFNRKRGEQRIGRPIKLNKCNKKVSTYISDYDYDILVEYVESKGMTISQCLKQITLEFIEKDSES